MRKINPKSNNADSFKYSILIAIHYCDIPHHREKTTKLDPFANDYNFDNSDRSVFEKNNPNISLTIFDENNKLVFRANNDSINKARIVKISEHRFDAINPSADTLIKIKQLIKSLSQAELKQILTHLIKHFDQQQLRDALMDIIKGRIVLKSE